ncbi:MAG: hypothetical protein M0R50_08120 [Candidatus Cloacimonetes bacterium]|jgi:hypothetical protein|nr:hypothetical protein [Candidatus Cloacimonadota bacterium]
MRIIKIPIIESAQSSQAKLFNKLPAAAKRLFNVIVKFGKSDRVSIDSIRNLNLFGTTQEIEQLLFTLESRGLGDVKIDGAETYFIPNKVFAASV